MHTKTKRKVVNSKENSIDFYLSKSRDKQAAKRFFKKALAFSYVSKPRLITVDKNPAYPVAIQELKEEKHMPRYTTKASEISQ